MEKINQQQKELGNEISSKLTEILGKKVEVGFLLGKDKGFIFDIFDDKYDYKKIQLNYLKDIESDLYISYILDALKQEKYEFHESTPEERYVIDILEETKSENLYIIDGILCNIGNEYEIDLSCVDALSYNRPECNIYITSDEEQFYIDLVNEKIEMLGEESYEDEVETITPEFLQKVTDEWNSLNYWCSLEFDNNFIYLYDKEHNKKTELLAIDDIQLIRFKDNTIDIDFDEDENGFDCLSIDRYGVTM
ncbi:hypothetical protein CPAST_c34880 [Clostridium pasteurianum DSM 525 = ATCC 6013]|uniref:Uncharacterized protein n=1 Tax=Clostridium pasteurianum DSM 525 = ATCC 6013 TaxID=1262449 RepID=A0A0H3J7U4_CLOPA|nr:hypothetical protein [Clostridium pasteurianum]AJA49549.1 hypothetical protein CPAST_c34880 [Clostridium pasteurianum DSM 525 = ATCC 6013]AJA53537.1 hypothetical protein CLPA_c34880 [Clostridium pasteurianum DSM 525 = ATCC 6013]AOZ76704.1 hypothetical protein AQ983_16940 [Clostridium pasteurianum DSM 525 = ATCC 6013]AOZ80501.1 hypothetical protein AQ984_16935 [Clostridium pasteurianum]ELP58934.1 hypothetical protein F502_12436 [Clostridium pasteurianum DSM 525 = ATCC 6013]